MSAVISQYRSCARGANTDNNSGGKLVVFEVTEDVIRARFAFGLLPGWWLSRFMIVLNNDSADLL